MKRLILAVTTLASCLALACVLCACSQQSSSSQSEDKIASYASESMINYKGTLYYANFGYVPEGQAEIDGATKLKLETSNFLIYEDTVYYTSNPNGTSGDTPVELHSCGLDGSNDKTLAKDAYPAGKFYVVSGHLVYQHMDPIEYTSDEEADSSSASDDSAYSESEDIASSNESIYWQSLDLSSEKAEPAALDSKKEVQVVAASADALYYAKTDAMTAEGAKLFKAGIDLSDEKTIYEGKFLIDDCAVDTDGNLIVVSAAGEKNSDAVVTFDKDDKQLAAFNLDIDDDDTDTSYTAGTCGLFVTNAKNSTITSFDPASGDKTEHKVAGDVSYYISVQYADDDQVIYVSGIDEEQVDKATEESKEDSLANNTVLYQQKWGGSQASKCGTWFES